MLAVSTIGRIPAGWYSAILAAGLLISLGASASAEDGSHNSALKGGLQEDGQLNPSIKVVPNGTLNGRVKAIQQFAGTGQYKPGQPAPIAPPPPPKKPDPPPLVTGVKPAAAPAAAPAAPAPPKPPPKWDYSATPKNGLMNWSGGPQITVVTPRKVDGPVGGSLSDLIDKLLSKDKARSTTSGQRLATPARATPPPPVVPLTATPLLSRQAAAAAIARPTTWKEWYLRVIAAIYDQWARASTGPGTARIQVTVFRTHDIDCQVVDFTPAADAQRNIQAETVFRQDAIRSIYNLRRTEILGFPYSTSKQKVTFELDMRREVNGPAGCDLKSIKEED
jgi:hypothetical protein